MDNLKANRNPVIVDDERCRVAELHANPLLARIDELEEQLVGARGQLDKYKRATFELSDRLERHGLPGDHG